MKVGKISRLNTQFDTSKIKQQISFGCQNSEEDTFTKSTAIQSPMTLNITQEQSRKILSSPDLMKAFSDFVTNGLTKAFLQLVELANGGVQPLVETADDKTKKDIISEKQSSSFEQAKIEKLQEELSKLKEENKNIKDALHKAVTMTPAGYSNGVNVKYPRKTGMSKEERKLEELVSSIRLPLNDSRNLTDVIYAIHEQKEKSVRDEYIQKLYKDLSENKFDEQQLINVVIDYYNELYPDSKIEIQENQNNLPQFTGEEIKNILNNALTTIEFPKRKGVMPKELGELKAIVETTPVPESYSEKLKFVCKALSIKGTNKNEITSFSKILSDSSGDTLTLAQNIESWYQNFQTEYYDSQKNDISEETKLTNESQTLTQEMQVTAEVKEEPAEKIVETKPEVPNEKHENVKPVTKEEQEEEVEVFRTETEVNMGRKEIGKMVLDPVEEAKRKARIARAKEKKERELAAEAPKNNPTNSTSQVEQPKTVEQPKVIKPVETVESTQEVEIESPYLNRNSKFYFKMPEEKKLHIKNTGNELKLVINSFKKLINPIPEGKTQKDIIPVPWIKRFILKENIKESQILCQLSMINSNPYKERYKHINEQNAHYFVDIINKHFKGLFDIHSAMRLIDRFIDFENDEEYGGKEPYENQCIELIKTLKETIHDALNRGVNIIVHEDTASDALKPKNERKAYKGAAIVIPPEYFSDKAKKFFKDLPLRVALCEIIDKEGYGGISTVVSEKDYKAPTE